MEFLGNHWELIVLGLTILISILNKATEHFTTKESKVQRVFLFITEVLSVLKSSNVPGLLKLPLTSKKPEGK